MTATVVCPGCEAKFAVKEEHLEKRGKCPRCGRQFTISRQPPAAKSAPAKQEQAPEPDEYTLAPEVDVSGRRKSTEGLAEGSVCSSCGKTLAAGAIVCLECGYNIKTGTYAGHQDASYTTCSKCGAVFESGKGTSSQGRCEDCQSNPGRAYLSNGSDLPSLPRPLPDGQNGYVEVLHRDGRLEQFTVLASLRKELIRGKLDRHYLARWVEPRPSLIAERKRFVQVAKALNEQAEQAGVSGPSVDTDEYADRSVQQLIIDWELRRRWRPIGVGLAVEELALLYTPVRICTPIGALVTGLAIGALAFVVSFVVNGLQVWEIVSNGSLGIGLFTRLLMIVVETLIGGAAGAVVGTIGGAVVGLFMPRPPKDGFRRK